MQERNCARHDGELERYVVVRVADEFVVDLLLSAGGLAMERQQQKRLFSRWRAFRSPSHLRIRFLEMKQTGREKESLDPLFLRELLSRSQSD
jgi:hypothetical protein